jgi:hypothetical protein
MKNLNSYTDQARTKLFDKTGAFFAFGNDQFEAAKKEGVNYASVGAGLICPVDNVKELIKGLNDTLKEGIKQDVKENGINKIILRELYNYESFYTYETEDATEALQIYGVTEEQIQAVFNKEIETNGHKH